MVQIDWNRVMAIAPETMTERDKDDLYESLAWYRPDGAVDKKDLIHLFRLVQEILKFKSEQVDSLMNELDDIAAKQGEEEAQNRQDLVDEIEQLKEQLEYQRRLGQGSGRGRIASGDDLRSEIVKLEMQNEELVMELHEREKDLMKEKLEAENLASQVATLEREKQDLRRELTALQDDAQERIYERNVQESEFGSEKQEELTELIRQKNKHISQLLEDIDILEKQNETLKSKLTSVCDELSENAGQMNETAMHLAQMKVINEELKKNVQDSDERCNSLMRQIEELVEEKANHDKQLDHFNETLNAKIQEWKETLEAKDVEIGKAEEEIARLRSSAPKFLKPNFDDLEMSKKVREQEEQIMSMKNELVRATQEINNCTDLIESFKEQQAQLKFADTGNLEVKISMYEDKIRHLEEKLKYAEEDAQAKAEEISEIIIQLREYEMGEFGLSEAIDRIRKLEKTIEKRDMQIEKLVESCNNMEIEYENVEEQNMALRERLGLSASEEIDTSGVKLKYRKDLEVIESLKFHLDKKEEELIKAKLKCRKLLRFIKLKPKISESSVIDSSDKSGEEKANANASGSHAEEKLNLEKRLTSIIKENDALRKGMHEILESIQSQDGAGTVEIQSNCLERLLEALDSRHVSGWYHPAMRLQAQLNNAEGKNEELRNQIRSFREEEKTKNDELREAQLKIRNLENQLFTLRSPHEDVTSKSKTPETETDEVETGTDEKRDTSSVENEQKIVDLENEVQELRLSLSRARMELETERSAKLVETEEMSSKIAGLEQRVAALQEEKSGSPVDSSRSSAQAGVLERRVNFLKELESAERANNEKLSKEMLEQEEKFIREILRLQSDKMQCLLRVEKLENDLLQCVPKSKLNEVNKELMDVSVKYEESVALALAKLEDNTVERLEEEIRLLQKEKNETLNELRIVKERLIMNEGLVNGDAVSNETFNNDLLTLAGKLAASEVRELNEKQKSSRLEQINLMLKSDLQECEAHNKDISAFLEELKESRRKFQEVEKELMHGSPKHAADKELKTCREKVEQLEKKLRIAEKDRENFRELFEISRGQCRSLESYREREKLKISSLNEQVLLLQSSADEKAVTAKLSHELLTSQISNSQLAKEKKDLQDRLSKLVAKNLVLEMRIDEAARERFETRRKYVEEFEYLHEIINDLRKICVRIIPFPNIEMIHNMKKKLVKSWDQKRVRVKELKNEMHEYSVKKSELDVQMEGLRLLTSAAEGDGKELMAWYNKGTDLRLEEVRCRRRNQFLTSELAQLEDYVKKMDEEVIALEESGLAKEREWERKQVMWEQSQLEMFQLLKEKGIERGKRLPSVRDAATETIEEKEEEKERAEEKMKKAMEDQAERIKKYESEMKRSEAEITQLRKDLSERRRSADEGSKVVRSPAAEPAKEGGEETEKAALKVTVQSLESIIRKKEETIFKYQELLQEGRNEYSKSSGKLQEELRTLHEALAKQSKAYAKLKSSLETNQQMKECIPKAFEKYLTKIHELEDELSECQMTLTSVNSQLFAVQHEKEKWRNLAEERMALMNGLRQRLELEHKHELESYKSEMEHYQEEIRHLKESKYEEEAPLDGSGDHHRKSAEMADVQEKELEYESDHATKEKAADWSSPKSKDYVKEMKSLEKRLKFARDEASRLREQLRFSQSQKSKRPKTASSVTSRSGGSEPKSSLREESLLSKIKTLEELLRIAKEREHDLIEGNQRRVKSAEEVARWGEKKKSQQTIQNLNAKLKEREAEMDVLKSKNESFRNMIHKNERDRNALEVQLKALKDGPNNWSSRVEKLTEEKSQLESEVKELKEKLEIHERHEGGTGAAMLYNKLESQERKLAALELASHGRTSIAIVEELEKLQANCAHLEKMNLGLESESLALHLQLEKEKGEVKCLLEKNKELEKMLRVAEEVSELRKMENERTISSLSEKVDKMSERKKTTRGSGQSSRASSCSEKVKKDFAKLKEDHKALRKKYLEVVDKNAALEEELKKCRYQIHLLEEKDLADSLSKTNNIQLASELSQELLQVKAQLAHKTLLLGRVKVLLTKAAEKERALREKVDALQNMVPVSGSGA